MCCKRSLTTAVASRGWGGSYSDMSVKNSQSLVNKIIVLNVKSITVILL